MIASVAFACFPIKEVRNEGDESRKERINKFFLLCVASMQKLSALPCRMQPSREMRTSDSREQCERRSVSNFDFWHFLSNDSKGREVKCQRWKGLALDYGKPRSKVRLRTMNSWGGRAKDQVQGVSFFGTGKRRAKRV